jgi:hypothetical protein
LGCWISPILRPVLAWRAFWIDTEKSVKYNKGYLLLHNATSFDPTVGSSSGDYIRIKKLKVHEKRVPYEILFGLHRTSVHTKCRIIYTHWIYCADAIYQQVYRMAEKVVSCCRGTTVCEVGSGVLTGYCV